MPQHHPEVIRVPPLRRATFVARTLLISLGAASSLHAQHVLGIRPHPSPPPPPLRSVLLTGVSSDSGEVTAPGRVVSTPEPPVKLASLAFSADIVSRAEDFKAGNFIAPA